MRRPLSDRSTRQRLLRDVLGFGCDLLEARERAGWTQAQLADAADCTREHVSQIERGVASPSMATLGRLREALFERLCIGT